MLSVLKIILEPDKNFDSTHSQDKVEIHVNSPILLLDIKYHSSLFMRSAVHEIIEPAHDKTYKNKNLKGCLRKQRTHYR